MNRLFDFFFSLKVPSCELKFLIVNNTATMYTMNAKLLRVYFQVETIIGVQLPLK